MWFITSILTHGDGRLPFHRTFGFYAEKRQAEIAVEENRGNMHECMYNFLVIEEIGEGVHALAENEQWYRWDDRWVPCKKPKETVGVINWAIG